MSFVYFKSKWLQWLSLSLSPKPSNRYFWFVEKIERLFDTRSCPASKVVLEDHLYFHHGYYQHIVDYLISFLFQVFYVLHSIIFLCVWKFHLVFLFYRAWVSAASILGHICLRLQCAWFPRLHSLATTQQYTAHFCS